MVHAVNPTQRVDITEGKNMYSTEVCFKILLRAKFEPHLGFTHSRNEGEGPNLIGLTMYIMLSNKC